MKTLSILTIFSLLWLNQGLSQTQELIINGSFTTPGLSGCWVYGSNAQRKIDEGSTQYSYSGPACGEVSSLIDINLLGLIQQSFLFPANVRSVIVKFKYYTVSTGVAPDDDRFLVSIFDPFKQEYSVTLLNLASPLSGAYLSFQRYLTPREISNIYAMDVPRFNIQGTGLSAFYTSIYRVDDVSLLAEIGAPVAEFGAAFTHVYRGNNNEYYDSSSAMPTSWLWKFYDGSPGQGYQTSTVQNPENIKYNYNGKFDVSLTATNANGSETKVKTNYITVLSPAGIESTNSSLLWLRTYPNPVIDVLNLEFKEDLTKEDLGIKIYNQIGELVISELIKKGTTTQQCDFSNFSSGVYMIYISTENGENVIQKVIK